MSAPRKRTNEQILSSLACNISEGAQVLNVAWETMRELVETGKVRSFEVGSGEKKRQKISVESLRQYARGEAV